MTLILFTILIVSSLYVTTQGESTRDTTPPTVAVTFDGPQHYDGIVMAYWVSAQTTIWLNATDSSGVAYLHYELWRDADLDDDFETLEREVTVFDNGVNDSDPSMNIAVSISIQQSCHHRIEYYAVDKAGNVNATGSHQLREEWHYQLQPIVTHMWQGGHWAAQYRRMAFGSSPAAADVFPATAELEIIGGSDETNNVYPEVNSTAREGGIWRCWSANGSIQWATLTGTDESRSSPAVCDINGDGALEIAAGTTSGWNVEVMDANGNFLWTFPATPLREGSWAWHSSPALVDVVAGPHLTGKELIIGNNPYKGVWCFDGDNSDGVDNGITISSSDFPWGKGSLGAEGTDWDVLWIYTTGGRVIASPAVDDIDNDGKHDVVVGDLAGTVYALRGDNGYLKWSFTTGAAVYSSAALANLDDDLQLEAVVGSNDTRVYCIDGATGTEQWNYTAGGAVYSSPAIGDVDADGSLEIIFGSLDGTIYCLNDTGSEEWRYSTGGAIYSSPSLAAVPPLTAMQWPLFRHDCQRTGYFNGSAALHIFIGSDDGYLYNLYGTNGTLASRFRTNGPIHTSPTVADIDRDGAIEMCFYDWGKEWGGNDTFWCLEEPYTVMRETIDLYVDTTSPELNKTVGQPHCEVASDEYCITTDTPITINGSDHGCANGSGVAAITYRIWKDGIWGPWQPVQPGSSITIQDPGTHYIEINVTDHVNNTIIDNETFHVDDLAPVINKTVGQPQCMIAPDEYCITSETPITVDAVDQGCCPGVVTVEYRVDTGQWQPVTGDIYIQEACTHTLSLRAYDCLGNIAYDNETFHVDDLAPVINKTVGQPQCMIAPDEYCITSETPITVDAVDQGCCPGVVTVEYRVDTGQWQPVTGDIYIQEACTHTLSLRAYDCLGNIAYDNETFHVDDLAPVINKTVGQPQVDHGGDVDFGVTTITPIYINASSGCCSNLSVAIRQDDGPWTPISVPYTFFFPAAGYHTLNIKAYDCLGHIAYDNESFYVENFSPHLTLTKDDSADPVHPGDIFTYTIQVGNTGMQNATNVTLIETYDPHVSYLSASPSPTTGTTIWVFSSLNVSETRNVTVTVQVDEPLPNGTLLNNIVNTSCDQSVYNETDEKTTVHSAPHLTIDKTARDTTSPPLKPGDTVTYRLFINNTGDMNQSDNPGDEVVDAVPMHTSYIPGSLTASAGTAVYDAGDDQVVWNGGVPVGESVVIAFNVTVDTPLDNETTLVNDAVLSWDSTGDNQNNMVSHAYANLTVTSSPELLIVKTDSEDPTQPGNFLNYTILINNTGDANATNVVVTEVYDGNVTFVEATPSPDVGNTTWVMPLLSANDSVTINVRVRVDSPLESILLYNVVNVTCDQGVSDDADETTQVISAPDLEVTKEAMDVDGTPLQPGDQVRYTITITNTGDKNQLDNPGDEVVDAVPMHTSYIPGSLTASAGTAVYDAGDDQVVWNGGVPVGESVVIAFNVTVDTPLDNETTLVNDAVLSWDSTGDNQNNMVSHAYANLTVTSSPELLIVKTDSEDPTQPGNFLNYTILINNTGDANATNVVVTEVYDGNVTFVEATPSPITGSTMIWEFSSITAGSYAIISVRVLVHPVPNGTILYNHVNVTCDGDSNETDETTLVESYPTLTIEKSVSPPIVEAGGTLQYSVWVNNTGTAPATNVVVTETYDTAASFLSASPWPDDSSHMYWTFPVVQAGDTVTITISAHVSTGAQEGDIIHNQVDVTCDEGVTDTAWANATVQQSAPPHSFKKFHGYVYNVTYFDGENPYVVHYVPNATLITLVAIDLPSQGGSGVNHTYYRIFKWNYTTQKWNILFNWQEYGVWNNHQPYNPINLSALGLLYGYPPCGKYQIEFYSVDHMGNTESMKWNDVYVDCQAPRSQVNPLPAETQEDMLTVTATASDDGGIKNVTLYYRYSADNDTWSDWQAYGTTTMRPYAWAFTPPHEYGYYQFVSIAVDYAGHTEAVPTSTTTPDAVTQFVHAPWDVNGDGAVNISDVFIVAQHWMQTPSSPDWDPATDVNNDGIINIFDMVLIGRHWTG